MARLAPLGQLWAISRERAISGTTAIVLPLAVGVATGHVWFGATASLGGFAALYGHDVSYRRRGRLLAGVCLGLTVAAGVGAAFADSSYRLALALGLVALVATVATEHWRVGPPGATMAVLVGGTASSAALHAPAYLSPVGRVGTVLLLVGAGAVVAWLAAMARWLRRPVAVEQRTVRAAVAAVTAFIDDPSPAGRAAAAKGVRLARSALGDGTRRESGRVRELTAELDAAQRRFLCSAYFDVITPIVARPAVERTRRTRSWSLAGILPTSGRVGVAVALSGVLAAVVVPTHVYWAALTAVAVLQGPDLRTSRSRVWQRAVGTVVGVLISGGLLSLGAPPWAIVVFVAVLQLLVEVLVAHVYALAVVFITPLTLLLAALAAPEVAPGSLVVMRLVETAIGCLVAFLIGILLWPRAASRRLDLLTEAALAEIRALLDRPADTGRATALHGRLLTLHTVAVGARGELFGGTEREHWLARSRLVEDLGWTVLSARERGANELLAAAAQALPAPPTDPTRR